MHGRHYVRLDLLFNPFVFVFTFVTGCFHKQLMSQVASSLDGEIFIALTIIIITVSGKASCFFNEGDIQLTPLSMSHFRQDECRHSYFPLINYCLI